MQKKVNEKKLKLESKKNEKKPAVPVAESKPLELPMNDHEQALIENWRKNKKEFQVPFQFYTTPQTAALGIKPINDRGSEKDKQHLVSAGLCSTTGARNANFAVRLFQHCADASGLYHHADPEDRTDSCNSIAEALYAMKPQDEFEGMIITRLISLHFQSMKYLDLSSNSDASSQSREMHLNRSTKLIRLFNESLETLMRYRRKGEQKVVVQHVNVEQGGQAIVGDVHQGGGVIDKSLRGTP